MKRSSKIIAAYFSGRSIVQPACIRRKSCRRIGPCHARRNDGPCKSEAKKRRLNRLTPPVELNPGLLGIKSLEISIAGEILLAALEGPRCSRSIGPRIQWNTFSFHEVFLNMVIPGVSSCMSGATPPPARGIKP